MDKKLAKTVVFVVQQTSNEQYGVCKASIEALHVPEGYCVEIYPWIHEQKTDIGERYNKGYRKYCGKYKIYLSDKVCILHDNFIEELYKRKNKYGS